MLSNLKNRFHFAWRHSVRSGSPADFVMCWKTARLVYPGKKHGKGGIMIAKLIVVALATPMLTYSVGLTTDLILIAIVVVAAVSFVGDCGNSGAGTKLTDMDDYCDARR